LGRFAERLGEVEREKAEGMRRRHERAEALARADRRRQRGDARREAAVLLRQRLALDGGATLAPSKR
jgi:hypothetical protein